MKKNKIKIIIIIICLLGITTCLLLLIPQIRQMIIKITEQFFLGRELKDHAKWHQVLFSISIEGSILFGLFICLCIFSNHLYKIIWRFADFVQERQRLRIMKKSHQFLVLIIIYLLTLGIRIYWLTQKNGIHLDEGYSVVLACYNDYMLNKNYELNKGYTGKEVKEISLCKNDSIKIVFGDIYRLWKDNRDPPHTNLYYSLFRLSLAGLKTGNIKPIIFRGGILNLIFFTGSFIFFFLLMKLFFVNSRLLQFSVTACAFLSTATISNTLFLRPYQIQETMFIVFCYYFFKTFSMKKYVFYEERLSINTKLILFLSLVTAITLLTGYYAIIFIGLFGLYVIYINLKRKNYTEIGCYIVILFLSILFAQILYTRFLTGFTSYRALETKQTLFISKNITFSIWAARVLLQEYFFNYSVIAVCVFCLIFLIFRKKKLLILTPALFVFAMSILYVIIVLLLAPYKTLRYIMPVFPFFVIFPALMIYSIRRQKLSILVVLLLCVFFLKDVLNKDKIGFLFQDKNDEYYFNRDVSIPVFVINTTFFKYSDMVPYFNDKQMYYFFDNYQDILLSGYDEFYLVIENTLELPDTNLSQFKTEQEFYSAFFVFKKYFLKKEK